MELVIPAIHGVILGEKSSRTIVRADAELPDYSRMAVRIGRIRTMTRGRDDNASGCWSVRFLEIGARKERFVEFRGACAASDGEAERLGMHLVYRDGARDVVGNSGADGKILPEAVFSGLYEQICVIHSWGGLRW